MVNLGSLYWLGQVEEDLEEIRVLNLENKDFQILREEYKGQELEIVIREILFLNARCIQRLKERIEDAKADAKRLGTL